MVGSLAEQVRLVAVMDSRVAPPVGHERRAVVEPLAKVQHLASAGVLVTPLHPLVANVQPVLDESLLVTPPHLHGRVVDPSLLGVERVEGVEDLERFTTLFPEPLSI